jgi:hypothetical protein
LAEIFSIKKLDNKLLSEYIRHLEKMKENSIDEMCSRTTLYYIFCDAVVECTFPNLSIDENIKNNAGTIDRIRHESNKEKKVFLF